MIKSKDFPDGTKNYKQFKMFSGSSINLILGALILSLMARLDYHLKPTKRQCPYKGFLGSQISIEKQRQVIVVKIGELERKKG